MDSRTLVSGAVWLSITAVAFLQWGCAQSGVAGTHDIVAMVANDDTCRPVAESGAATLVFRQSGRPAFLLGPCPVLAFARPL